MNPRKPAALKAISGTERPDRAEPEPTGDRLESLPPAPQHLNADGAAFWNNVGTRLVAARQLQPEDLYPFQQLAYAWQRHFLKQKLGVDIAAAEEHALTSMFAVFGIGPAQRRRLAQAVTAAAAHPGNRFAKFDKRGA